MKVNKLKFELPELRAESWGDTKMELVCYVASKPIGNPFQILNRRVLDNVVFGKVSQIKSGCEHFLFASEGRLFALGSNMYGQAGLKGTVGIKTFFDPFALDEDFTDEPIPIEFFSSAKEATRSDYIVDIECGNYHSVCLSKKGRVFNWGANFLGHGRLENTCQPLLVTLDEHIKAIKACGNATFAQTKTDRLFMWGCIPGLIQLNRTFLPKFNYCFSIPVELRIPEIVHLGEFVCTDYGMSSFSVTNNLLTIHSIVPIKVLPYSAPNHFPINPAEFQIINNDETGLLFRKYFYTRTSQFKCWFWSIQKTVPSPTQPYIFFVLTKESNVIIIDTLSESIIVLDGLYADIVCSGNIFLLLHDDGKQVFLIANVANQWQLKRIYECEQKCYAFSLSNSLMLGLFTTPFHETSP